MFTFVHSARIQRVQAGVIEQMRIGIIERHAIVARAIMRVKTRAQILIQVGKRGNGRLSTRHGRRRGRFMVKR